MDVEIAGFVYPSWPWLWQSLICYHDMFHVFMKLGLCVAKWCSLWWTVRTGPTFPVVPLKLYICRKYRNHCSINFPLPRLIVLAAECSGMDDIPQIAFGRDTKFPTWCTADLEGRPFGSTGRRWESGWQGKAQNLAGHISTRSLNNKPRLGLLMMDHRCFSGFSWVENRGHSDKHYLDIRIVKASMVVSNISSSTFSAQKAYVWLIRFSDAYRLEQVTTVLRVAWDIRLPINGRRPLSVLDHFQ